jgi:hypothetical protein
VEERPLELAMNDALRWFTKPGDFIKFQPLSIPFTSERFESGGGGCVVPPVGCDMRLLVPQRHHGIDFGEKSRTTLEELEIASIHSGADRFF